ncbi:hypothetical protein QO002_005043 [Pararhizobium capsulatum DSM 1112]|uniref:Transposase n=1 Tax=Pararhizobium capsulatum DSM 1112 TaxID=1121113 RepID=A0ABU0C159_9HYPH|nr:hypothetical protein [Pararhizobium capsulatum DSM 1112]
MKLFDRFVFRKKLLLNVAKGDLSLLARLGERLRHVFSWARIGEKKQKARQWIWPAEITYFPQCQYIRGHRKADIRLCCLEIASRHLARLVISLQVEADLLTFDEFAHTGALYGRDVNEGVRATVVGLNEAEALGGIKPFNCASGHDEPFHSNTEKPQRQSVADGGSDS